MNLTPENIVKRPLVTEQGMLNVATRNIYPFAVDRRANKVQIGKAIESLFKVRVISVNTASRKGKPKRLGRRIGQRPDWKKAYVKLHVDDKIELF